MMNKRVHWSVFMGVVLGLFMVQCGDDNGGGPEPDRPFENIHLDLFTAEPLQSGMIYELWVSPKSATTTAKLFPSHPEVAQNWVSLGKFNVMFDGTERKMVDTTGAEIVGNDLDGLPVDLEEFDSLFITIEPMPDADTLPSGVVYMRAQLELPTKTIVNLEFPSDLLSSLNENAIANFLTPTDSDTSNELSGVWFMFADFTPSLLSLPLPPDGWIYEGWGIHANVPWSTGKFTDYQAADMGNPYSGGLTAPSVPGEDFLTGDPSFPFEFGAGDDVVVTLEPDTDWDPAEPFPFKIYIGDAGATPVIGQPFNLDAVGGDIDVFPEANALITRRPL